MVLLAQTLAVFGGVAGGLPGHVRDLFGRPLVRIRIAVTGARVHVRGEVDSVDVLDEILGIVGDVVGVEEVLDEVNVSGI